MLLGYKCTLIKTPRRPPEPEEPAKAEEPVKPERARDDSRWVHLEQAIMRALLPFPAARLAVSLAMDAVEAVSLP